MSGGSDIQQFLQQDFIGPVFSMMCFFGVLFVVMVAIIIYMRQRRSRNAALATYSPPVYSYNPNNEHEMPDLGLLVHAPPQVAAAAVQAAAPTAPPAPARAARKGTFSITPKDGSSTEAVEVMTILRDVVDGRLIVQMGDRVFQNINSDADFRDRFTRVLRELGESAAQVAASSSAASVALPVVPPTELLDATEDSEDSEVMSAPPEPPPAAPPPAKPVSSAPLPAGVKLPGDLPSFKLDDNPIVKKGRKLQMKPVQELNVANAIESFLQFKLQNTPEYLGRSIHIYPSPDGGVSIEVDGRYYDAVGDIEDARIREFIAGAIQEWQERH